MTDTHLNKLEILRLKQQDVSVTELKNTVRFKETSLEKSEKDLKDISKMLSSSHINQKIVAELQQKEKMLEQRLRTGMDINLLKGKLKNEINLHEYQKQKMEKASGRYQQRQKELPLSLPSKDSIRSKSLSVNPLPDMRKLTLNERQQQIQKIENNRSITQLDLSGIHLKSEEIKALSSLLTKKIYMTTLNLSETNLCNDHIQDIVKALYSNNKLTAINLKNNKKLTDEKALKQIDIYLKRNAALLTITFSPQRKEVFKTLVNNDALWFEAACQGWYEVSKALLDANFKIKTVDSHKATALHIASQKGHLSVVKLLVEQHIDLLAKNDKSESALDLAIRLKQQAIVGYLEPIILKNRIRQLEDKLRKKSF